MKITDIIENISWDNNYFYINCENNKVKISIIDGEINIPIYNNINKVIYINELNVNDNITVIYKNKDEYIYPLKIILNDKYDFHSSSEEEF